jgi:hypothetical protein
MRPCIRPLVTALSIALAFAAPGARVAAAQDNGQPTEFESWRLPGWTFTPGISLGTLYDTNVTIRNPLTPGGPTTADKVFVMAPMGQLEYFSPRTSFSSGRCGGIST